MEYLQLFDEKGTKLDEKIARDNKKEIKLGKYFMIVLIIIENANHEFLMQVTSEEKGHELALTGGHVQYGSDGITTCIKEVKEELGLDLKKEEILSLGLIKGKAVLVSVYYIKKNVDTSNLILQNSEVESVRWVSMEEIEALINDGSLRNTNIPAFEKLREFKAKQELLNK